MRKTDNLPPSYAVVTKSGNLNFLEPSGPLQACNGTGLALPFTWFIESVVTLPRKGTIHAVLDHECERYVCLQ